MAKVCSQPPCFQSLRTLLILTTPGQVSGSQVLLPALLKLNASATVDIETCFTADSLPYRLTLSNDGLETLACVSRAGSRHGGVCPLGGGDPRH